MSFSSVRRSVSSAAANVGSSTLDAAKSSAGDLVSEGSSFLGMIAQSVMTPPPDCSEISLPQGDDFSITDGFDQSDYGLDEVDASPDPDVEGAGLLPSDGASTDPTAVPAGDDWGDIGAGGAGAAAAAAATAGASVKASDGSQQPMSWHDAAITMAAFTAQTPGHLTKDKLKEVAADPRYSPQVRQAASMFLNNPTVFDQIDGNRGNASGYMSRANLEEFVRNGSQVDAGQASAQQLKNYMNEHDMSLVGRPQLEQIMTAADATPEQKAAAKFFLDNPDAFNQADGAQTNGKGDGLISARDLNHFTSSQIHTEADAVKVLHDYQTRGDDNFFKKLGKIMEKLAPAIAGVALLALPGVGEIADAALLAGEVGAEALAGAGEAAAAGAVEGAVGEAAGGAAEAAAEVGGQAVAATGRTAAREVARSSWKEGAKDFGKEVVDQAKDQVKDELQNQAQQYIENAMTNQSSPDQPKALDGNRDDAHTINMQGLLALSRDPNAPVEVRKAVSFLLSHPGGIEKLMNMMDGGQTGTFDADTTGKYDDEVNDQMHAEESEVNLYASDDARKSVQAEMYTAGPARNPEFEKRA